jgi:hypothetical protein
MALRMACMRRTLMRGSRCATISSGAVGRKPHGASRRVTVGAWSYILASSVQRAADAAESVPRTTAATTHRQKTCNGALRARGGVQQTGNAQRSASRAGWRTSQQGGPVRVCVGEARRGREAPCMADRQQRRSSRNARWRSIRCNRRDCSTARHGTERPCTARPGGLSGEAAAAARF